MRPWLAFTLCAGTSRNLNCRREHRDPEDVEHDRHVGLPRSRDGDISRLANIVRWLVRRAGVGVQKEGEPSDLCGVGRDIRGARKVRRNPFQRSSPPHRAAFLKNGLHGHVFGKRMVKTIKPRWLRIGGYFYPCGRMPIDVFWPSGRLPPDAGAGSTCRLVPRQRVGMVAMAEDPVQ